MTVVMHLAHVASVERSEPLEVDLRLLAGLQPRTQELYRKALEDLHRFLASWGPISRLPELDKAVAAYCGLPHMGSAEGDRVVAALEKVAPGCKGRLSWTHAILMRGRKLRPRRHTMPMPLIVMIVIAWQLAMMGHPRVAGLLVIQWLFGLRPGEAISIQAQEIVPSSLAIVGTGKRLPTIILKPKVGTKVGRPQVAMPVTQHAYWADVFCAAFHHSTERGSYLTTVTTTSQYGGLIDKAVTRLQLRTRYTAHSPRAGWATALRVAQVPFGEIMELGRRRVPSSVRVYLDVGAVLSGQIAEPSIEPLAQWLLDDLFNRFPWW